jgi:hypothetical protein
MSVAMSQDRLIDAVSYGRWGFAAATPEWKQTPILASLIRTDIELYNQLLNHSSLFHETLEKEFSSDGMLEYVKIYIPMEDDQRVIIKFFFNEQCDANRIVERLGA